MTELLLRGGLLVTEDGLLPADIKIGNGKIVQIAAHLPPAPNEINVSGMHVLPAGVDSHCHIEQRTSAGLTPSDNFFSASVAALCGGTTTLLPFACQHRGERIKSVVSEYRRRASKAAADYSFHVIVSDVSAPHVAADLAECFVNGVSSVKVYMTYDALKLSDTQMLDVLLLCRQHGAMVMVHAESHELVAWITAKLLDVELGGKFHAPHFHAMARPAVAEREAAHRAISFAEYVDTPLLIVHVSSGDTAAEIGRAKQRDIPIYGETCPQYLYLTDKCLCSAEGAKFLCSPPLRTEKEQAALWQALNEGVLQVVSSDHSAYNYRSAKGGASKTMGGTDAPFTKVPMGLPGLECRLPLLYSAALLGKISLTRMVEVVSTNPAKVYGLYPRKGALAVGADADIVVCDPNISSTIGSRSLHDELDYTPYEGVRVQGAVMFTLLRGDVVFRRDLRTGAEEITAARGGGQWCAAHTPHLLGHTNGARAWPCEGSVVLQRAAAFDAAMRGGVQQHPAAQRASEADETVEGETQPGAHTQAKEAIYDPAREGETACVPCDASDAEVWQLREKADL